MRIVNRCLTGLVVLASAALSVFGQGMMRGRPPAMWGLSAPTVGAGAEYKITMKDRTMEWTYAVVGKETVDGQDAYWLEMRGEIPNQGKVVQKMLMVVGKDGTEVKRMIMQAPGRPPMEMPMGMMGRAPEARKSASSGEKVGSESVTVPAGTYDCDHYRSQNGDNTTDAWVSTKVPVFGVVKSSNADMTMVLEKVLENQKSEITGEPQQFSFPHP
jgi:Domain of unknown function (DUF4412)